MFAVAAEEFGLLASLGLIALFGALAFRGLSRASRLNDPFEQIAGAGLITLLVAAAGDHHVRGGRGGVGGSGAGRARASSSRTPKRWSGSRRLIRLCSTRPAR